MPTLRERAEGHLAAALSRQIGYTTGAYDLMRFVDIAKLMVRRPFVLLPLMEKWIRDRYGVGAKYARGVLDVATALGVLGRIGGGQRIPRYVLSSVGRSVVAADAAQERELLDLTMVAAILDGDADAYGAVLEASGSGRELRSDAFRQVFSSGMTDLRAARRAWLEETIPNNALRRRVTKYVPWWGRDVGNLNQHFVRHHCAPRLGWARVLGHVSDGNCLTEKGVELLNRMRDGGQDSYFWLGPSEDDLKVLRIRESSWRRPLGGAWRILRPTVEATDIPEDLLKGLLEYMRSAYEDIRLATANQAPTAAVLPFIYAFEVRKGERYDSESVLGELSRYDPSSFTTLKTRDSLFGYYVLKR